MIDTIKGWRGKKALLKFKQEMLECIAEIDRRISEDDKILCESKCKRCGGKGTYLGGHYGMYDKKCNCKQIRQTSLKS